MRELGPRKADLPIVTLLTGSEIQMHSQVIWLKSLNSATTQTDYWMIASLSTLNIATLIYHTLHNYLMVNLTLLGNEVLILSVIQFYSFINSNVHRKTSDFNED